MRRALCTAELRHMCHGLLPTGRLRHVRHGILRVRCASCVRARACVCGTGTRSLASVRRVLTCAVRVSRRVNCDACPTCEAHSSCDGSGTTTGTGKCVCDIGWAPPDCTTCSVGRTGPECAECEVGYFGPECSPCPGLSTSGGSTTVCSTHGTCDGSGTTSAWRLLFAHRVWCGVAPDWRPFPPPNLARACRRWHRRVLVLRLVLGTFVRRVSQGALRPNVCRVPVLVRSWHLQRHGNNHWQRRVRVLLQRVGRHAVQHL